MDVQLVLMYALQMLLKWLKMNMVLNGVDLKRRKYQLYYGYGQKGRGGRYGYYGTYGDYNPDGQNESIIEDSAQ